MTYLRHIFLILTVGFLFSSCANYGVISDNDVYLQRPAAIDLTDDEQDITSFNAYKAGRNGAFQNGDPRLRNTNASIFFISNNPYAFNNSMFSPYCGYNDPFYWNRPFGMYNPYGPGWNYGWGYGYNYYYGYSPFMSPYYSHNYYGVNYIGSSSNYNGFNNSSGSGNQFYGPRTPLSGNSGRSSSYPQTLKNKMHDNVKPTGANVYSKNLSSQNIKNRRKVNNSEREYVRPNVNRNTSRTTNHSGSNRNENISSTNQRRAVSSGNNYRNKSYTPSNTARRTGTVTRSNTNNRTSGTYNSSNNSRGDSYYSTSGSRRGTYNSGNTNSRGSYSSPQRSSGSSYNRSSGSSNRSSGSSSRSRGGSSSSGRR